MPPKRKTPDPPELEKPPLERDQLTLEKLGQMVAVAPGANDHEREAFERIYPDKLQREAFFQSPVDKSAWTIPRGQSKAKKRFVFKASGVLRSGKPLIKELLAWLGSMTPDAKKALGDWVTTAIPPKGTLFDEIEEKLREAAVEPETLYNRPICRLVLRDQLRYDPNYQALYQITPAQEQLMEKEEEEEENHDRLKRNQRLYWGISEIFQSLVALFDSDLGKGPDAIKNMRATGTTKELIRIAVQEKAKRPSKALSPAGLNRYSPLRFWSPPPSFALSVFHMLFWRSIITGKDLFGREVDGESVQKRAESYYVIVNYFNPAKFRIADYPNLFRAILTIARELAGHDSTERDLPFPDAGRTRLFYPRYFPDVEPRFQGFEKLTLSIPFSAYPTPETAWDLAAEYKSKQPPDLQNRLLQFLRDRAIELILWSTYQMEIRSIGLIPIQYLYHINLSEEVRQFFEDMSALHRESPKNFAKINEKVSEKLLESNFNSQIELRKAYGGPHRDIFEPEIFKKESKKIKWLEDYIPNPQPSRASAVSASSDDSATRDKEEDQ